MKMYIKRELMLIFNSKRWLGLAFLYLLFMFLPLRQDFKLSDPASNNLAYYMTLTYQHSELFVVLCTLVALLVGDVLAKDFRERIAIISYTRSGTFIYILSKYLSLIVGATLFVLLLNLIYVLLLLPKAPFLTDNNQNIIETLSSGRLIQSLPPSLFYLQLFTKKLLETLIYVYPCLLCSMFVSQKLLVYIQPIVFYLFLRLISLLNIVSYKWRLRSVFSLYNYLELSPSENRTFEWGPIEVIGIYWGIFFIITFIFIGLNYYLLRYRREELS